MILLLALATVPFMLPLDPAPGFRTTRDEARRLDCERVDPTTASRQYPGQIEAPGPRGELMERRAVVCRERMMQPGLRSARDEAILSTLQAEVSALASEAAALRPDLAEQTWLVETYYPSVPVSQKVSFAAKDALVRAGLSVSDRAPGIGAADLQVITRMPPEQAYPAACLRYRQTGSLGEDDVLLAVVHRDPRETILHAGLCSGGQWTWLQ